MAEGFLVRKGGSAFTTNAITRNASTRYNQAVSPGEIIGFTETAATNINNNINPANNGSTTTYTYASLSVALSPTQTFNIAFDSTWWAGSPKAFIMTYSGTNKSPSVGTVVTLNTIMPSNVSLGNGFYEPSLVKLNDGRVMLFGSTYYSSPINAYRMAAFIFSISATNVITLSSSFETGLVGNANLDYSSEMAIIDNNKVLAIYSDNSNRPSALVLTINGNSITRNNPFLLATTLGSSCSITKVGNNKFVSTYRNQNAYPQAQVMVYSEGDTVTMGTNVVLTTSPTNITRVTYVDKNHVVIVVDNTSNQRWDLYRYTVDGGGLNFANQSLGIVSTNSSYMYARGHRWVALQYLSNNRVVIGLITNTGSSSGWRHNLVIYNWFTNTVIYNNSNPYTGSTSSGEYNVVNIDVLDKNNIVYTNNYFDGQYNRNVLMVWTNMDIVVDQNPVYTSVRGFTKDAAAANAPVDVYISNSSSSNPMW
jgi:hypothetical protein